MTENRLKLNDDKTEALLVKPKKCISDDPFPESLKVGIAQVSFSEFARDLGFIVSADLSLQRHVTAVCNGANYEIRKIAGIRQYLSIDATKKLVCAFVLSRLDHCNALLSGCDKALIDQLQIVQNSAARLISRSRRRDHITPILRDLHWLKIAERIDYKLCCLCYSFFVGACPSYFSSLLTKYTCPKSGNRSASDDRKLRSSKRDIRTVTFGERTFSFCAPLIWNSLPFELRHKPSAIAFKTALKTYLFHKSYL